MRDAYRRVVPFVLFPLVGGLLFADGADAQQAGEQQFTVPDERVTVKARSGATIPAGNLGDITDAGFNAGLGVGIPLAERVRFTLAGDVSLLSEIDTDGEFGEGEVEQFFDDGLRLWSYGGGLEFDLTDPAMSDFSMMLSAGAGATTIDPQTTLTGPDTEIQRFDTETRFSANAGVELGYRASENVGLFLGADTRAIFLRSGDFEPAADADDELADQIDDTWWAVPVRAGIQFRM